MLKPPRLALVQELELVRVRVQELVLVPVRVCTVRVDPA